MDKYLKKIKQLEKLIGNTPMVKIKAEYKGEKKTIFAKLEWYNFSGSIKDRVALEILKDSYISGNLKPNQEIVEVTSGNTGISFACLGAYLGHKVTIIMPDWLSKERQHLLKMYGANLKLVSRNDGGFNQCFKILDTYKDAFKPMQFENRFNTLAHFKTTGKEIVTSLKKIKAKPKAFVCGVGTAGTLMGVGLALKKEYEDINCYAVEPASSPTLKLGYKVGKHIIEGISDDFIPAIFDKKFVKDIVDADNYESVYMAQKLSRELGFGVGISSGANFISALKLEESSVVTTFADDNKKYVSTSLSNVSNVIEKLDKNIKLLDFETLN